MQKSTLFNVFIVWIFNSFVKNQQSIIHVTVLHKLTCIGYSHCFHIFLCKGKAVIKNKK